MFDANSRGSQRGVSLIEMIFVIVILSLALVGIANTISGGTSRSSDTLTEIRSIALAQAYLDEIIGKRFDEGSRASGIPPCRVLRDALPNLADGANRRCSDETDVPPPGPRPRFFGKDGSETRATFDDVDDYHNLIEGLGETAPFDVLRDANNEDRGAEYGNFRVEVVVSYYDGVTPDVEYTPTSPADEELDDMYDAKLIVVTVFFGAETEGLVLSAYKSNF